MRLVLMVAKPRCGHDLDTKDVSLNIINLTNFCERIMHTIALYMRAQLNIGYEIKKA